jgi:hypothetical protein
MPNPPIVFGFILATLYGAFFHLLLGGNTRRLALFLAAGWLGFTLGQIFGSIAGVRVLAIGSVNTLAATLGAFLALVATHFLTFRPAQRKPDSV